jgi:hypothetical protein
MPAAFCPTEEQRRTVEAMVSFGIPQVDIGRVIGIDPDTLRKHFREELDTGMTRANARVAAYLFEVATGQRGDGSAATTAAIFWCKTRLRWKETVVNEVELRPGDLTAAEKSARAVAHLNEVFGAADAASVEQTAGPA